MICTKRVVSNALNEIFFGQSVYTHEDEFNYYFKKDDEFLKVRKFDLALFYRFNNQQQWEYDMNLLPIEA